MQVNCPTCQALVEWQADSPHRPFCSKQCQLIDLGEWADEEKSIPCGASKEHESPLLANEEDIETFLTEQEQAFFKDE